MKKAFTEIGWGNPSFISTEIEYPNGSEIRQRGFVKFKKMNALYARCWIGKKVFVIDSEQGFNIRQKNRRTFKFVFGVSGEVK